MVPGAPLSILWLNQLDPGHPWAGGAERHIEEVGRRLVSSGHRVTVVAERFGDLPAEETRSGIRILRPVPRGLLHAWTLANARRLLDELRVDVVIGDLSKIVPWGQKTFGGRPLVSVVRHLNGRTIFGEVAFPAPPVLWLIERFTPAFLRSSDVITESRATAEVLRSLGATRGPIALIAPGVDGTRFRPDPASRSPTPLIVYVGRMKRYKRLDLALRAFAELRTRRPAATFHLAGGGSDHDRLRELASELGLGESVQFLGTPSLEEIVRLYQRGWVHVQPSSAEGWGLTAIESLACGTPVVAFAGGALSESVGPLCQGLLAAPATAPALAAALERGLDRPEVRDPVAAARLAEYARSFTWESTAAHYEHVLRAVVTAFPAASPTWAPFSWRRVRPSGLGSSQGVDVAERAADRAGST